MIEQLSVHRLSLPLTVPYKLAFGSVAAFDTILAEARVGGRPGLGEATILTGYTDETIEESWARAKALTPRLQGVSVEAGRALIDAELANAPFTATALATALEMATGHPLLAIDAPAVVPLQAGINATDPAGIEREIEAAIGAGFGTLKIKVGFEVESDLSRVALIQRLNRGRSRLRIDANQGYGRSEGCQFASSLAPDDIELLEQPCAASDWEANAAVAKVTTVPLMLDESIYGLADIERAAALGARFVKLKLMKMGSLDALAAGLERIRALGMEPVLGNGVSSDVGCWMEACVARRLIANAGEFNGYLRQRQPLVTSPLPVVDGVIRLAPGFKPSLDRERVRQLTVDSLTAFGGGGG
jgi:L-Ala-D/L-Glu epimerase